MTRTGAARHAIGLSLLPGEPLRGPERRARASAEAMRVLSLLARRPAGEGDVAREAGGRPFFPGREVDFSVSHSGSLVAVSLASRAGARVGCDVERALPRLRAAGIARGIFSAEEEAYVFPQGRFDQARFYEIWTLKECYVKLRGLSVFDMARAPSFAGGGRLALDFEAASAAPLSFALYELSGGAGERYVLASAIEGGAPEPPELRWFSEAPLACKEIARASAAPGPG